MVIAGGRDKWRLLIGRRLAAAAGHDLKFHKIVVNMSHGNGSSAFIFQVTGILKPVTDSTDKMLKLSHSNMAGCNSLYGSNFDFCMTYFRLKCQLPLSNYNSIDLCHAPSIVLTQAYRSQCMSLIQSA